MMQVSQGGVCALPSGSPRSPTAVHCPERLSSVQAIALLNDARCCKSKEAGGQKTQSGLEIQGYETTGDWL